MSDAAEAPVVARLVPMDANWNTRRPIYVPANHRQPCFCARSRTVRTNIDDAMPAEFRAARLRFGSVSLVPLDTADVVVRTIGLPAKRTDRETAFADDPEPLTRSSGAEDRWPKK